MRTKQEQKNKAIGITIIFVYNFIIIGITFYDTLYQYII